ncbi:hypothetical protein Droror1_Dr00016610 [Drosera rotundifolia]
MVPVASVKKRAYTVFAFVPIYAFVASALYKDAGIVFSWSVFGLRLSFALTNEGVPKTPLPPGPLLSVLPAYEGLLKLLKWVLKRALKRLLLEAMNLGSDEEKRKAMGIKMEWARLDLCNIKHTCS